MKMLQLLHGAFLNIYPQVPKADLYDIKIDCLSLHFKGIFSPVKSDHEKRAAEFIKELYPEVSITLSHELGSIGLLERENAAILNESLKQLCKVTIKGFRDALDQLHLSCPFNLTQNDGTLIRYSIEICSISLSIIMEFLQSISVLISGMSDSLYYYAVNFHRVPTLFVTPSQLQN